MTISTTNIKNSYSGNGSTSVFQYTFKITLDSEIQVIIRASTGTETVKNLTTHYTVSGAGNASGGNVTFTSGNIPTNTETVILRRNTTQVQALDLVENDPFSAETVESAFDKSISLVQELQEQVDRSIKISRTNTMTSTEFTDNATDRASKILAFDTNGELSVATELGSYKGNWSASTAYGSRDIVKDTSTNNIFIANTTHTSSGSQPLTTNTDSAKWDLLVDAATATTAQTAASNSATASANSATASANSATAAATSETNANTHKNAAQTAKTAAETAQAAAETAKTAAETALDTFDDRFLGAKSSNPSVDNDGNALIDGAIYFNTTTDVMNVYDATNTQWRQLALTGTNQTNVNTVAGQISPTNNVATVAGANANISTVAGQISPTNNIATLAGISGLSSLAAAHAAVTNVNNNLSSVQNFANVYRIASSAPSSSLNAGDLYFDTTADELKVYKSGGWAAAGSTVNGTSNRFTYNITGTPTTLTGASGTGYSEASSKTLAYDAGFIDVYLNGVKQVNGTDVTVTSGNSVVFASALAANDVVDVVAFGTFQLANISINSLTDTPASLGSAGQALVVNNAGNALVYSNASTPEVYGFEMYYNASTLTKTVTVAGGKFVIDGVSQDTLDLYEGNTYKFDLSDSSTASHPFRFATAADAAGSTEYTTGVTTSGTQGQAGAYVQIVVASNAPTLYYYCSSHSGMGGTANTPIPANNSLRVITTNEGADNISSATYANFGDVVFASSGITWSLVNTELVATI